MSDLVAAFNPSPPLTAILFTHLRMIVFQQFTYLLRKLSLRSQRPEIDLPAMLYFYFI